MELGGVPVGEDYPAYVIAEIGHNHQGDCKKAAEMFELAKLAGCNAVKLQRRSNRALFTKALYDSPYNNDNSYGATYGAHREALELSDSSYRALKVVAERIGITMFATAFDEPSAEFLNSLGVPMFKIASADLPNTPLIRKIAGYGKPMIISTGGGTLEDVRRARNAADNVPVVLLQCTAAYPCVPADMNLRVIQTYKKEFPNDVIGLSDHQDGIALGPAAYALGARVFEKHFTFSHSARGTDHAFSLEPGGIAKYISDLGRTREALGDGNKGPLPAELKPLYKMAKGLYTARALPKGHILQIEDIAIKSPSTTLPPYRIYDIVGATLKEDVGEETALCEEMLKWTS